MNSNVLRRTSAIHFLILLLVLASSSTWAETPSFFIIQAGTEREYSARIEPGTFYVVNFVSGPQGSDVAAKFSANGPVVGLGIVHPRSDLVEHEKEVQVKCPGFAGHELRVGEALAPLVRGTLNLNSVERGHFGAAFRNDTTTTIELQLTLVATRSSIATTIVDMFPNQVIKWPQATFPKV